MARASNSSQTVPCEVSHTCTTKHTAKNPTNTANVEISSVLCGVLSKHFLAHCPPSSPVDPSQEESFFLAPKVGVKRGRRNKVALLAPQCAADGFSSTLEEKLASCCTVVVGTKLHTRRRRRRRWCSSQKDHDHEPGEKAWPRRRKTERVLYAVILEKFASFASVCVYYCSEVQDLWVKKMT